VNLDFGTARTQYYVGNILYDKNIETV